MLRRVVDGDEQFLRDLYATTRAVEMAMVPWNADERQAFLEMQFRAQHADYSTRFPAAEHSVVLIGGRPAGRVWIDRRAEEIRLLDIAIMPDHQNAGIGAVLLGRLQDEARAAGVALRHSVARGNTDALRFYQRLGFAVVESWEMHDLMEWLPSADATAPQLSEAGG